MPRTRNSLIRCPVSSSFRGTYISRGLSETNRKAPTTTKGRHLSDARGRTGAETASPIRPSSPSGAWWLNEVPPVPPRSDGYDSRKESGWSLRPWRRAQSAICGASADATAEILQTLPAACPRASRWYEIRFTRPIRFKSIGAMRSKGGASYNCLRSSRDQHEFRPTSGF